MLTKIVLLCRMRDGSTKRLPLRRSPVVQDVINKINFALRRYNTTEIKAERENGWTTTVYCDGNIMRTNIFLAVLW